MQSKKNSAFFEYKIFIIFALMENPSFFSWVEENLMNNGWNICKGFFNKKIASGKVINLVWYKTKKIMWIIIIGVLYFEKMSLFDVKT